MTEADRRLAAVAAALAGGRAGALLARAAAPKIEEAVALATRLGGAPRAERLRAVADAFTVDAAATRERAAAAAAEERGAVARHLAGIAAGVDGGAGLAGLVRRLCRERIAA